MADELVPPNTDVKPTLEDMQDRVRKLQRERDAFCEDVERLRREKAGLEGRLGEAESRLREAGERRVADAESIRNLEGELESVRLEARTATWAKNDAECEKEKEGRAMGSEIAQLKQEKEAQKRQIAELKRKLKTKTSSAANPRIIILDDDDLLPRSDLQVKEQDLMPNINLDIDRGTSVATSSGADTGLLDRFSEIPPHNVAGTSAPSKRLRSEEGSDADSEVGTRHPKRSRIIRNYRETSSPEPSTSPQPETSRARSSRAVIHASIPSSVKTQGQHLELPASLLATYLHSVLPFSIFSPGPSSKYVSRTQDLQKHFGGNHQSLITRMAAAPGSAVKLTTAFPQPDFNPLLPSEPGMPGLMFASREDIARPGVTYTLFCRRAAKGPVTWLYMGEYAHARVGNVSGETWTAQTTGVQMTWAKHIFKTKRGVYAEMREELRTRKRKEGRGELAVKDIVDALCSGENVTIGIIQMRCVGYDHAFARRVEESVGASASTSGKGKGAPGKNAKKSGPGRKRRNFDSEEEELSDIYSES